MNEEELYFRKNLNFNITDIFRLSYTGHEKAEIWLKFQLWDFSHFWAFWSGAE